MSALRNVAPVDGAETEMTSFSEEVVNPATRRALARRGFRWTPKGFMSAAGVILTLAELARISAQASNEEFAKYDDQRATTPQVTEWNGYRAKDGHWYYNETGPEADSHPMTNMRLVPEDVIAKIYQDRIRKGTINKPRKGPRPDTPKGPTHNPLAPWVPGVDGRTERDVNFERLKETALSTGYAPEGYGFKYNYLTFSWTLALQTPDNSLPTSLEVAKEMGKTVQTVPSAPQSPPQKPTTPTKLPTNKELSTKGWEPGIFEGPRDLLEDHLQVATSEHNRRRLRQVAKVAERYALSLLRRKSVAHEPDAAEYNFIEAVMEVTNKLQELPPEIFLFRPSSDITGEEATDEGVKVDTSVQVIAAACAQHGHDAMLLIKESIASDNSQSEQITLKLGWLQYVYPVLSQNLSELVQDADKVAMKFLQENVPPTTNAQETWKTYSQVLHACVEMIPNQLDEDHVKHGAQWYSMDDKVNQYFDKYKQIADKKKEEQGWNNSLMPIHQQWLKDSRRVVIDSEKKAEVKAEQQQQTLDKIISILGTVVGAVAGGAAGSYMMAAPMQGMAIGASAGSAAASFYSAHRADQRNNKDLRQAYIHKGLDQIQTTVHNTGTAVVSGLERRRQRTESEALTTAVNDKANLSAFKQAVHSVGANWNSDQHYYWQKRQIQGMLHGMEQGEIFHAANDWTRLRNDMEKECDDGGIFGPIFLSWLHKRNNLLTINDLFNKQFMDNIINQYNAVAPKAGQQRIDRDKVMEWMNRWNRYVKFT